MNVKTGDWIETRQGEYFLLSCEPFGLMTEDGEKASVILVDKEQLSVVAIASSLDALLEDLEILTVIPNSRSLERRIRKGDYARECTGIEGVIADIEYEFDRYQFAHLSGWRHGIKDLEKMED